MDTTYKKKPFILYPFIGAYSFIKWFFIGLISSFVFIVSTITDICIYAIKGVYHLLVTIPKDLINNSSKKISENYEKKKSQNITSEMFIKAALTGSNLYSDILGRINIDKVYYILKTV